MSKSEIKVLGICGSLRRKSFNLAGLRAAGELMPAGMSMTIAEIGDLPLYNQDVFDAGMPEPAKRLRAQIAAADGGLSTVMSVNNSPDCAALLAYGSPEQKERWLKPLAKGEVLGAFCLTEPHAGSDASNLKTRAERRGNGWVLNGVKQFITSGRSADMALVFAVTDPASPKRGISCFIVPTKMPGYRVASVEKKLGQKSSDTCQIAFEDCAVGADAMLGEEGGGYRVALANLSVGRIGIAAQAVGMARAAFEAARAYAGEREAFGRKIGEFQMIQQKIADMVCRTESARALVYRLGRMKDAGTASVEVTSILKRNSCGKSLDIARLARDMMGGNGISDEFGVARHLDALPRRQPGIGRPQLLLHLVLQAHDLLGDVDIARVRQVPQLGNLAFKIGNRLLEVEIGGHSRSDVAFHRNPVNRPRCGVGVAPRDACPAPATAASPPCVPAPGRRRRGTGTAPRPCRG